MVTLADEQDYVRVLYYGRFGTGKTTDMAYMAHSGPVQWIRADKGLKVRPLKDLGIPVQNIEPRDELRPESLEGLLEDWRGQLHDHPGSLAGIVLDTVTELVARRIEVAADVSWRDYLTRCGKQHVEPDPAIRYRAADDTREWYGVVTQEMSRLVRHMTDLPWHVAIAAQIRSDVDKATGLTQYGPAANPAVAAGMIGYCDLVIETEAEGYWHDKPDEQVFVGHPRPRPGHEGKDRFHALPRFLAIPTFDRVLGYVAGTLDFRTDPVQERYRAFRQFQAARKAKEDEL